MLRGTVYISPFLMSLFSMLQLSLFCLCLPFFGLSQEYTINLQAYGVEEGLLHRYVSTVFEDDEGIIWLGSRNGLQRFDGEGFKSWTSKSAPIGKIVMITAIGQDQEGWLWLWNNDLLEFVFFHPKTEKILTAYERFGDDFPIKNSATNEGKGWRAQGGQLKRDSKGKLYFISNFPHELITFDAVNGFSIYPLSGLEDNYFQIFVIDHQDLIWIGESDSKSKLYALDTLGRIVAKHEIEKGGRINAISELNGTIYYSNLVSDYNYYYKIDQSGRHVFLSQKELLQRQPRYLGDFSWDYHKNAIKVYVGDDFDQPIFDLKFDNIPKQFYNNFDKPFKDSKGRYWFSGHWGLGLAVIKPNLFKTYGAFDSEIEKPINNSVRGILVEEDTVYANFEFGGLVSIPKKAPQKWKMIYGVSKNHSYLGRPLAKAETAGFYVGYAPKTIIHRDPVSGTNTQLTFRENSEFPSMAAWSFYTAPDQKLWIGMDGGIAYKNPNEDYLNFINSTDSSYYGEFIFHICPDGENKLWLSGAKSLYLFDTETKAYLAKYGKRESGEFNIPVNSFYYLYIDKKGVFWLGTNEGLLRWNRKTNEQKLFTTIDGLSNNVIYAIFEDDDNNLWLSSDYGIMKFNKTTHYVNAFLKKDGISHEEFNRTSAFKEEDGTIYFGGLNGITAFHPKDFVDLKHKDSISILISNFEIFDGKTDQLLNKVGEIRDTKTINFHPNDRFFRLTFALPLYENASKINYAWKVEGVDRDWNYQKENTLQIGKLPYGNHMLRVKGQDNSGAWSKGELEIRVNVIKPIYLQVWFIVLAFLSFLIMIAVFFNWRTRQLKLRQENLESEISKATIKIGKQTEELKQLDKVKSRFFTNVSHELRTPLTLMLGPISSILKNNNLKGQDFKHLKKAQENGKELLKLVASILDLSKLESGKLELQENSVLLFPLIRRLSSSFESHAERTGIRFTFVYKAAKNLQIELDVKKLEIVVNNLLSNAFKFSQTDGQVVVTVIDRGNAIRILVEDKGRGIHPSDIPHVFDRFYQSSQKDAPTEGGTGIGLALCQELVKVMEGKIWVESEWGKGSTFFVELPRKEVLRTEIIEENQIFESEEKVLDKSVSISEMTTHVDGANRQTTLLLVEDNYSLRDYLKTILEPYYTIWTAENGQQALEILKENQQTLPSLVLSDIMMPIMDGFQLLETLKTSESFRHLPVVMLTARADVQDKIKALRIGVDDYLLKPFEEEELLARVENILNNYQERLLTQQMHAEEEIPASSLAKAETSKPSIPAFSAEDLQWLETLEDHLVQYLSNNKYTITQLAFDLAISERQLRRRIKALTGLSPSQYFKETRLQAARQLLEQRKFNTIAQIAFAVGFQNPGAFSRNFSSRFGKKPSEYFSN